MRVIIFLTVTIFGYRIDHKKASSILSRGKRANEGYTGINELKDGGDSFERECVEEDCNFEEFDECFDQESGYVKTSEVSAVDRALGAACLASARTEAVEGEQRISFMRKCLGSENSKPSTSENQRFGPIETETELVTTTTVASTTTSTTTTTTSSQTEFEMYDGLATEGSLNYWTVAY